MKKTFQVIIIFMAVYSAVLSSYLYMNSPEKVTRTISFEGLSVDKAEALAIMNGCSSSERAITCVI